MNGNDIAVLLAFLAAVVSFAGFTGIVTSIDRRTVSASSNVISFRVSGLITSAILGIVLALSPILLESFGVPEPNIWQLSSAMGSIGLTVQTIGIMMARARMTLGRDKGLSHVLFIWNSMGVLSAILVMAAGAVGQLPPRGALFFGLLVILHMMSLLFYRIMHMADEAARAVPAVLGSE